jgi:hypothetical protein
MGVWGIFELVEVMFCGEVDEFGESIGDGIEMPV